MNLILTSSNILEFFADDCTGILENLENVEVKGVILSCSKGESFSSDNSDADVWISISSYY